MSSVNDNNKGTGFDVPTVPETENREREEKPKRHITHPASQPSFHYILILITQQRIIYSNNDYLPESINTRVASSSNVLEKRRSVISGGGIV